MSHQPLAISHRARQLQIEAMPPCAARAELRRLRLQCISRLDQVIARVEDIHKDAAVLAELYDQGIGDNLLGLERERVDQVMAETLYEIRSISHEHHFIIRQQALLRQRLETL